jgi:septum formation inhibitor MinC
MEPIQIQIADIIARNSDKKAKHEFRRFKQEPMIATVLDSHIYMETVSKAAIQDIII